MGAPAQGFSQEEILAQQKELEQAQKRAGGIIDNSGPIAPGIVESGQMSQESFDKMKGNTNALAQQSNTSKAMSTIGNIAKKLQNPENAENKVAPKNPFESMKVEQPKDIMGSRRSALLNLLKRR